MLTLMMRVRGLLEHAEVGDVGLVEGRGAEHVVRLLDQLQLWESRRQEAVKRARERPGVKARRGIDTDYSLRRGGRGSGVLPGVLLLRLFMGAARGCGGGRGVEGALA